VNKLSIGALMNVLFSITGRRRRLSLIRKQEEKIKWLEEKLFNLDKHEQNNHKDTDEKKEYENQPEQKQF
jgi:hypothetical protein